MKYQELTGNIIGAAMEVHRQMKNGYQEYIYQRALAIELKQRGINFEQEFEMKIHYKGEMIGLRRVDFLIHKIIPLELKAVTELSNIHLTQTLNYLETANYELGLLINFEASSLKFHRLQNKKYQPPQNPA